MRRPVGPLRPVTPEPADDAIVGSDRESLALGDDPLVERVVVESALGNRPRRHTGRGVKCCRGRTQVLAERLFHAAIVAEKSASFKLENQPMCAEADRG